LDASGKPVVAFWADNGQTVGILRILHCGDANCASGSALGEPDTGSGGNVGFYPSMQLDAAGNPVVAYYDSTNGDLKLLHCGNPNCGGTLTVPTSNITGTGVAGDSPSGTAAALAQVNDPTGLSQSSTALYFADTTNCEVKKIESGFSYTIAGTGATNCGYSSEGTATNVKLNLPRDVFLKGSDLYIADSENCRIRKITGSTISTVAGTGTCGFLDGTVASAQLNKPKGVAVDGSGNIYIADTENCRIRKVSGGSVSTIAGTTCGFAGDGGPATAALLNKPTDVAFLLPGDDLVIADAGNNRIRRYSMSTGMITTIAGTGSAGFSGDGGQATSAKLSGPEALTAIDSRVLIADTQNNRIRRVNTLSGVIDTIVGVGGQTGSYALSLPQGVAVVAGGGGGGAGAAAGQGEAAGPDVATAGTTFANSGANLIGVASGSPANDNRGNFRPTTSCSVTPHVSSIDFAILPVMLGLIGFRRRLRVLFITLRSMLTPKRPSSAPAA
jgi:sugar lactone lactonase YvrE